LWPNLRPLTFTRVIALGIGCELLHDLGGARVLGDQVERLACPYRDEVEVIAVRCFPIHLLGRGVGGQFVFAAAPLIEKCVGQHPRGVTGWPARPAGDIQDRVRSVSSPRPLTSALLISAGTNASCAA